MNARRFRTWARRLRAAAALSVAVGPGFARDAGPERLRLEEAVDLALRRNLGLAENALEARRRELDVERARSAFDLTAGPFVQVSAPGGERQVAYGLHLARPLGFGTALGATAMRVDGPGGARDESVLLVDVTQPLFRRFGRAVAEEPVLAGGDRLRAARRHWEARKADLVLSLVTRFEEIARLEAQADSEREHLARLDRLAALSRARERQGRATRMDTYRVEVRLGETGARLHNALDRRAAAGRELAEWIGADPRETFALDPVPDLPGPLPDTGAAVALALDHRMDYAQALDDADAAQRREALAARGRWPDVSLSVSLRRSIADGRFAAGRDGETEWFAALASEGFPGRRADRLAFSRAELDSQSARLAVEWVRRVIVREVLQALAECRRAETEREIAERTRKLAEDGARLGRRLYTLGRTDGLSAEAAETQLSEAENRLLEARSAERLSRYALRHALGTLIEHPDRLRAEQEAQIP